MLQGYKESGIRNDQETRNIWSSTFGIKIEIQVDGRRYRLVIE